ncbi:hypothetical protein MDA_GLEAN10000316 [Myotis davidii]|uniref:Uncharacterized protein n=1 Tax=Myotis davidii TaxID=225400 RepID=L5M170_MYODS|nr:hypothetical protein MDA_GLEAN10000316 [Myotis davidii]
MKTVGEGTVVRPQKLGRSKRSRPFTKEEPQSSSPSPPCPEQADTPQPRTIRKPAPSAAQSRVFLADPEQNQNR